MPLIFSIKQLKIMSKIMSDQNPIKSIPKENWSHGYLSSVSNRLII